MRGVACRPPFSIFGVNAMHAIRTNASRSSDRGGRSAPVATETAAPPVFDEPAQARGDERVEALDLSKIPLFPAAPGLQPNLTLGAADDPLEREADRIVEAIVGPPTLGGDIETTAAPAQVQGSWSDAPLGPVGGARSAVTQAPTFGWNRGEVSVGAIRRIPIEGLASGNQAPDAQAAAEEEAAGRAIALIPENLDLSGPVDVLVHLHGHNIGYRQRRTAGPHPNLKVGTVRDVDTDRIEQQIQASGRPMIGVLPQGTALSRFGSFDSDAYIAEVLRVLAGLGAFGASPAPQIGRVLLSGHSGAGRPIAEMLAEPGQPRLSSKLGELALFDSINDDNQLAAVRDWVVSQLNRDLAALTATGITPAQQAAYLKNGMRFRAYYTNSSYAPRHESLRQSIRAWFNAHAAALGGKGSLAYAGLADNYDHVTAVGHADHEVILSRDNRLREAIDTLPSSPTVHPKAKAPNGGAGAAAPAVVSHVLQSPGQPLGASAQTFFRSRFGHDFSSVRIHTGERAAASAQAINASAYTVGRDIVFGSESYDFASPRGRKLLAHELAHVVQQSGAPSPARRTIHRQATAVSPVPIRADEAGTVSGGFDVGQFYVFVPEGVLLSARKEIANVKVHVFFAAGGVQGPDTNDVLLHGLRGASNQSEWVTIGIPGILNGANTISDAQIATCLRSVGIVGPPVAVRLTGHSRGCDSVIATLSQHRISTPIERVVFLDEAVEHVSSTSALPDGSPDPKAGSVRINRVQIAVQLGIPAGSIFSYESTNKSVNTLTGRSAKVAGATYRDLDSTSMAALGVARLVQDAIALDPAVAAQANANPKIVSQLANLRLPRRGSFTTGPSTGALTNINEFCFDPPNTTANPGPKPRRKASVTAIVQDPVLLRFINQKNLAKYSTVPDWTPFVAHEFFVAEIAHELTE